jgi:aquaporin Z
MTSPATPPPQVAPYFAELCGTFFLIFAGTGAIIINDVSGGAITHPGIALTFGLIVFAMIHTFGPVSGAHMNPAVTIGLAAAGQFSFRRVLPYWASQLAGALLASLVLRVLFPTHESLGATRPAGSAFQSAALEALLTLMLMLTVLRLAASPGGNANAGLVVGAVIALEAMFAGPICGASMNPARSLAPAIVSMRLESVWIYLVAPIAGALCAIPMDAVFRRQIKQQQ